LYCIELFLMFTFARACVRVYVHTYIQKIQIKIAKLLHITTSAVQLTLQMLRSI